MFRSASRTLKVVDPSTCHPINLFLIKTDLNNFISFPVCDETSPERGGQFVICRCQSDTANGLAQNLGKSRSFYQLPRAINFPNKNPVRI